MAVDEKILGVVWAETASLAAADGLATGKARLQAVVAYLFNRARSRGMEAAFLAPAPLPATTVENGDRRVEAMRQTVETALATGQYNGVDLPRRAVLWEVNTTGEPKQSEQPAPTWVKSGATRISDYRLEYDSTGRRFRLFESDDDPGADDAVFVSSLTKAASQRVVEPPRATKTRSNVWPWLVGLGAAAMFFWMALTLAYVGRVTSQAYKLLSGVETEYSGAIADETFAACTTVGKAAAARASTPAGAPIARVWVDACSGPNSPVDKTLDGVLEAIKSCGEAPQFLRTSPFCRVAWRVAAAKANSAEMSDFPEPVAKAIRFLSGWAAKASPQAGLISIAMPFMLLQLSIALLGMALGLGAQRSLFGVWIGPQYRISLARMQVSLWTIVIFGAYTAMALFNISMLSGSMRALKIAAANPLNPQAVEALSSSDRLTTFPTIPSPILAALGIAVMSPMISALIKSKSAGAVAAVNLQDEAQKQDKSGIGRFDDSAGVQLDVKASPEKASLADLFFGETSKNRDIVDVSRLQNVIITFILLCGYGTLLFDYFRDLPPETIARTLRDNVAIFPELPDPGAVFTTLLGASHATYLVAKQGSLRL